MVFIQNPLRTHGQGLSYCSVYPNSKNLPCTIYILHIAYKVEVVSKVCCQLLANINIPSIRLQDNNLKYYRALKICV